MAVRLYYFRREILWRPTESPSTIFYNFGKAKVGQAEVTAGIQEEVLWFEITVNYVE
jgi:hypothetical protein